MTVPGGALLRVAGRADRTVHVERNPLGCGCRMNPVDPVSGQISQCCAIVGCRQHLGLEPPHLAGGGGIDIDSPSADDLPHHRINSQTIRVIYIRL